MPVVDRNGPIEDAWTALPDGAPVPKGASIIVSLERLRNEHNSLFADAAAVGVEISGDVDLDQLKQFLPQLSIVVVRFDAMKDGRPFSIGRLLRERYGFEKDLRATGPFIPDQALFLLRCGYTSFDVDETFSLSALKRSIAAYSAWYQRASDRAATVLDLRHKKGVGPTNEKNA
jgi:uncharacterized protein (DUF934 family)